MNMRFQICLGSTQFHRKANGFSLVEVTLAVAIAAMAIITLLGLLPQGLEMSRKTALLTSESAVLEQIIRNLENMQWSDLPASPDARRYFNNSGQEVSSDSAEISFIAEIDYSKPASLPKSETTQNYLKRVIIKVAVASDASFKFSSDNRSAYVVFNHLVAKTRDRN